MEARALVREARSQYFPTVGVGGSYTRSRTSSNIGSTVEYRRAKRETVAGVCFSSRCFVGARPVGRVRNTVHASQYTPKLTAADLENERLTEQASLAEYFLKFTARMLCNRFSTRR